MDLGSWLMLEVRGMLVPIVVSNIMNPAVVQLAVVAGDSSYISKKTLPSNAFRPSYVEKPFPYSSKKNMLMVNLHGESSHTKEYCFAWRADDYNGTRKTKGAEAVSRRFDAWAPYAFSFDVLPTKEGFSADSYGAIIAQLHGSPDRQLGEKSRNPIWSLVYLRGLLFLRWHGSTERVTPIIKGKPVYDSYGQIKVGRLIIGHQNRIVIEAKDALIGKGYIRVSINGKVVGLKDIGLGYNDKRGPYLKFGLYMYDGKSQHKRRSLCFYNVKFTARNINH